MKPQTLIRGSRAPALTLAIAFALAGCDSGSTLLITEPFPSDSVATENAVETVVGSVVVIDDSVDQTITGVGESSDLAIETLAIETLAIDSLAIDSSAIDSLASDDGAVETEAVDRVIIESDDNDASFGAVAAAHIADRTSLGPVKIMAVGDSITHGVSGASSYRKPFTALLQDASCDFTMVGSQTSSLASDANSDCIDTDVIGDGWGWNGSESCVINTAPVTDVFVGAHEAYSANRADHFLTSYDSSAGFNAGIRVAIQDYVPDVVLLHIGSVDLYNNQTVGSTVSDIDDLLSAIYETKPDTLVLVANVIPWLSDRPYREIGERIQQLGDGIQEVVAERYDPMIKLVDVRTGFTESMMTEDQIHPNEAGEEHIAEAFMSVYESLADCS